MRDRHTCSAFSLVGILISMVIIVVLFSIMMTTLNKAVTGEGSSVSGTVNSITDELFLYAVGSSMLVQAGDNGGRFITPSQLTGNKDGTDNTTANLFSAMVMQNYTTCPQLIAKNEFSGYVQEKTVYDMTAYNPSRRVMWDKTFMADLADLSNTSFAHQPLFGERFDDEWRSTMNSQWPLLGNRGPKDGVDNPQSLTYGRNGKWGGHAVFGDGHTAFIASFTPNGLAFRRGSETFQDNLFKMDDGPKGADAVLTFTKAMTRNGPTLQWD
jgi:hypothetical protein